LGVLLHRRVEEDAMHMICLIDVILPQVGVEISLHLTARRVFCMAQHLSVRSSPSCWRCKHIASLMHNPTFVFEAGSRAERRAMVCRHECCSGMVSVPARENLHVTPAKL